ncbi:MAG: carboxypeptidase regulatory-like domain-containing protein [Planctomycetota bacterium]
MLESLAMRSRSSSLLLGVALLCACGGDDAAPPASTTGSAGASKPAKPEAPPVDASTAGSIAGQVRFSGEAPARKTFQPVGEAFCMQHSEGEMLDESLLVQDGRLANAFVWIAAGLSDYAYPEPQSNAEIDQSGCVFHPRVLGLRTRQTLHVKNSDPVLHNVHVKPNKGSAVNQGMPAGAAPRELEFKRQDVMMALVCDVHSYMRGWIGVVDHPYFAVTGADGAFSLDGVPPGTYTLEAWHETLGRKQLEITVANSQAVTGTDFVFSAK